MNVLIIGSGGREHALAWKAAQSPRVETVFVAPGNAGTATRARGGECRASTRWISPDWRISPASNEVGLTIVGPEAPLVAGVVDYFQQRGLRCFGPTPGRGAAGGLQGLHQGFPGPPRDSHRRLRRLHRGRAGPGLPARTGCAHRGQGRRPGRRQGRDRRQTLAEAEAAVRDMLAGNAFGEAGCRVVIEEFLDGEEASFIVMVDGEQRAADGHQPGPQARRRRRHAARTPAAWAPTRRPRWSTTRCTHASCDEVILPTVRGMAAEGNAYTGFLYAGLMIAPDGDAQGDRVQLPLRRPRDPAHHAAPAIRSGRAVRRRAGRRAGHGRRRLGSALRLGVVLAAGGYPGNYSKGTPIHGLDAAQPDNIKVFHAGTAHSDGQVVTSGGRVLCVTALGSDIAAAQADCYRAVAKISWEGMTLRHDIGWRAIARYSQPG